jgi:hypothetical protein
LVLCAKLIKETNASVIALPTVLTPEAGALWQKRFYDLLSQGRSIIESWKTASTMVREASVCLFSKDQVRFEGIKTQPNKNVSLLKSSRSVPK